MYNVMNKWHEIVQSYEANDQIGRAWMEHSFHWFHWFHSFPLLFAVAFERQLAHQVQKSNHKLDKLLAGPFLHTVDTAKKTA